MATVYKRGGKNKRGGSYYVSYFDHRGERISRSARTTDKATAERIAAKLEADAALRRDGVVDPTLDNMSRQSRRKIESHLTDYEAMLRSADCDGKHVKYTLNIIRWISKHGNFVLASEINADAVHRYAQHLRKRKRSSRTIQCHLAAMKAFTRWLAQHHKLPRDPLATVQTPNPATDRKFERRMLLPDEWPWLKKAIDAERYGMAPVMRRLLYATAIQTGLRSNELRSLRPGRCYLDSSPPYVTCRASTTKNGKEARQYVEATLAGELLELIEDRGPKFPLFSLPHESNMADMLRDDLDAARAAWLKEVEKDEEELKKRQESDFLLATNHEGEVFDFHCLRHTCGAWLALAGEHPKVIQTIMRHSSITLTMDTYGHLFPGQEASAVSRFGELMGSVG